jgi:tRNA (guanine37-N1)-methyltransferase
MKIDILTLFPKMFQGPFEESILQRAQNKKLVQIKIHNLRDWAKDRHKTVDDKPFGGGPGMILMIEPIDRAILKLKKNKKDCKVVLLTPQGKIFNQKYAQKLSKVDHLILICGHYEGFDQRIRDYLIDEELSIGKFVLTGGELPAMVVTDTIVRLIPGVINPESLEHESFSKLKTENCFDFPQYTRPEVYKGWQVPKVLLSGNHKKIQAWQDQESLKRSKK